MGAYFAGGGGGVAAIDHGQQSLDQRQLEGKVGDQKELRDGVTSEVTSCPRDGGSEEVCTSQEEGGGLRRSRSSRESDLREHGRCTQKHIPGEDPR